MREIRVLAVMVIVLAVQSGAARADLFTVTSLGDAGSGTLRAAILLANAKDDADLIQFSLSGTIQLASALPLLAHVVTLDGPGASNLTVRRNSGGAYPVLHSTGVVRVSGMTLTNGLDQEIQDIHGGGIWVEGGVLTLADAVVSGNQAVGIYATGTLFVERSTISGNSGNAEGGGIATTGPATLTDTTIANNTSAGIFALSSVSMLRCTISGNTSNSFAGGITLVSGVILDSTFSGNSGGPAGDLWTGGPGANITLLNSTFAGSSAPSILVPYSGAKVTMRNTIVAGTGARCSFANGGSVASLGNNLSADASCQLTQPGDLVNTDALLLPLAQNGGYTATHALPANSPAVNTGADPSAPATDQRGVPRIAGGTIDIGAYELASPTITAPPMDQSPVEGTTLSLSVTATQEAGLPNHYQWRKDGVPIPGATGSTYAKEAEAGDAGSYDVVVSNAAGSVTSSVATVTVTPAPDLGAPEDLTSGGTADLEPDDDLSTGDALAALDDLAAAPDLARTAAPAGGCGCTTTGTDAAPTTALVLILIVQALLRPRRNG